jgi:hypothetical protein
LFENVTFAQPVLLAKPANIPGLKTANSNAFRLNSFALFEKFWLYMSENLNCKQIVAP